MEAGPFWWSQPVPLNWPCPGAVCAAAIVAVALAERREALLPLFPAERPRVQITYDRSPHPGRIARGRLAPG